MYDVVIVGGGVVGAGLALALRQSGLQIALVSAPPHEEDHRLFALNASSCAFLEHIGVWPDVMMQASPIDCVHVSYQGRLGVTRLRAADLHLSSLGHVVPAASIESALQKALAETSTLTCYQPATVTAVVDEGDHLTISLQGAKELLQLQSRFVIGADGAHSVVRREAAIEAETFDYQQSALVSRITLNRSHHQIAYERFTEEGAIALLPLTNQQSALIWTAATETITQLQSLPPDIFLKTLQDQFGYRLGRLLAIGERYTYPLRGVKAKQMMAGRIFLLGNAMHTLHPIAAQGLNLALYEIAILRDHLMAAIQSNGHFSFATLQAASDAILKQQQMSMNISHRLSQLFSTSSPLMSKALQWGLIGMDLAKPIKKQFIQLLLGRKGRIPTLLLKENE